MGRYRCSAEQCGSSSESDIKFFKFPVYNAKKLRRWLEAMGREEWTPSRFSVLCIHHFEEKHIDRTGKSITLREDALPSIFNTETEERGGGGEEEEERKEVSDEASVKKKRGRPRGRPPKHRSAPTPVAVATDSTTETREDTETDHRSSESSESWSLIVDEELLQIHSFPHFFHGNYCVSQDIHWAPHRFSSSEEMEESPTVIQVTAPWQYLSLSLRGPLPHSSAGHTFLLSVTDVFSQWLEAWPLDCVLPERFLRPLLDVIRHFGFPVRILTRLPLPMVTQINESLESELSIGFPLIVQHPQSETVNQNTQLIHRLVQDLCDQNPLDWDLVLPAKVFSFCCDENPSTGESPFSLLCCSGTEPQPRPRQDQLEDVGLRDFVVVRNSSVTS